MRHGVGLGRGLVAGEEQPQLGNAREVELRAENVECRVYLQRQCRDNLMGSLFTTPSSALLTPPALAVRRGTIGTQVLPGPPCQHRGRGGRGRRTETPRMMAGCQEPRDWGELWNQAQICSNCFLRAPDNLRKFILAPARMRRGRSSSTCLGQVPGTSGRSSAQ